MSSLCSLAGPVGLHNIGQTCCLNLLIQVLVRNVDSQDGRGKTIVKAVDKCVYCFFVFIYSVIHSYLDFDSLSASCQRRDLVLYNLDYTL